MQIPTKILEANALEFRYPGASAWRLRVPRLEVGAGEHTYVFGPSGCGKSTLLQLMAGILKPAQGEISVLGENLSQGWHRDRRRAESMGFVFQSLNLVPFLDVVANVTLPCRFAPRRSDRAVAESGALASEAQRLLEQLGISSELWGRQPSQLSVGQQQRVAVARALIGRPPVIVCDEPTSALDPNARDQFVELLLNECRASRATAIVVSHDPALRDVFELRYELSRDGDETVLRRTA